MPISEIFFIFGNLKKLKKKTFCCFHLPFAPTQFAFLCHLLSQLISVWLWSMAISVLFTCCYALFYTSPHRYHTASSGHGFGCRMGYCCATRCKHILPTAHTTMAIVLTCKQCRSSNVASHLNALAVIAFILATFAAFATFAFYCWYFLLFLA